MAFSTRGRATSALAASLLVASLTLGACVSQLSSQPTQYRAAKTTNAYGYSSMELSSTEYRVMFKAAEATPADKVQEYTLYRAAELAKQKGFEWLSIVKTDIKRKNRETRNVVQDNSNTTPPVLKEEQCTMSGCNEPGQQPLPSSDSDTRVEKTFTKDVYYSIVVRMGDSKISTDKRAFNVQKLLSQAPDSNS